MNPVSTKLIYHNWQKNQLKRLLVSDTFKEKTKTRKTVLIYDLHRTKEGRAWE